MTSEEAVKKYGDKVSLPFVERRDGLPYDMVWYRGKRYLAPLSIASASEGDGPGGRQIRCRLSDQSGVLIETQEATLLFDWYRSILPPIRRDKPLHVFISHIHQDHFNLGQLSLAKRFPDVSVYLGYDYSEDWLNDDLEKLPEVCADTVSCFRENQLLNIDGGSVQSLPSTDLGVAFLVHINGMTFFHAGDLFPWPGTEPVFLDCIAPLQDVQIDYAMLPADPRFPEAAQFCVSAFLSQSDIKYFTPIHLWDQPDFIKAFAANNTQFRRKMVFRDFGGVKITRSEGKQSAFVLEL